MSMLAATAATMLLVTSPGANSDGVADRLAATGGFLVGNAHRCGIATDRVVRAGQTIRELIAAAAHDSDEQQAATEHFAKIFMATAVPEKGESKLVASCDIVTSEFQKFENHKVATAAEKPGDRAKTATGSTPRAKFRLGDGE
jgi:hypothetical protein